MEFQLKPYIQDEINRIKNLENWNYVRGFIDASWKLGTITKEEKYEFYIDSDRMLLKIEDA